jgi:thymidylate synthase
VKAYLEIANQIINYGQLHANRTHTDTVRIFGATIRHDMSLGFPLLTTRKIPYKSAFAEMLGFIRAYDSADQFRALGCKFWDKNANDPGKNNSNEWLKSPYRGGPDHIGRIYGVQARQWRTYIEGPDGRFDAGKPVDQLGEIVELLKKGIDNRRLIVTHLNPGEVDQACLWPCHMFYKFNLIGGRLNLFVYMRSQDLACGLPANLSQYSLLLHLIAQITGHQPGELLYVADDVHIYANHLDGMHLQVKRHPYSLPKLFINPDIRSLEDLETWVTVDDFNIINYQHHDPISYPMAV